MLRPLSCAIILSIVVTILSPIDGFVGNSNTKGVRFAFRYGGCPNTQLGMCPTAGAARTLSISNANSGWTDGNKFLSARPQFLNRMDAAGNSLDELMAAKKAIYEMEKSLNGDDSLSADYNDVDNNKKTSLSYSSSNLKTPSSNISSTTLTARFANRPLAVNGSGERKKSQFLRKDSSAYAPQEKKTNLFSSSQSETEILEKVKDVVSSQLGVDKAKINNDSSFIKDLQADSLDSVELVMAFEEKFGVTIPDEDATKITNVQEAVNYIKNALSK